MYETLRLNHNNLNALMEECFEEMRNTHTCLSLSLPLVFTQSCRRPSDVMRRTAYRELADVLSQLKEKLQATIKHFSFEALANVSLLKKITLLQSTIGIILKEHVKTFKKHDLTGSPKINVVLGVLKPEFHVFAPVLPEQIDCEYVYYTSVCEEKAKEEKTFLKKIVEITTIVSLAVNLVLGGFTIYDRIASPEKTETKNVEIHIENVNLK